MNALLPLLILALSAAQPAATASAEGVWPSPDPASAQSTRLGRYRVSYAATLQPVQINRMHAWVALVMDADGHPVTGATLSITGGMPEHDHGMPTEPQATTDLGEGRYLIEGMKFHMGGNWEVVLNVKSSQGEDSLSIPLDL